jgi:hypothetical protein
MSAATRTRSRVHHLGAMSRTELITIYQGRTGYDAFEVGDTGPQHLAMNPDQLITAILDHEDR